jgi:hypothetical protein
MRRTSPFRAPQNKVLTSSEEAVYSLCDHAASGNFTWPISAATVAQAKLLVYCQGAVRAENRLKPARNASSSVFLLSFLCLMLSTT